VDTSGGLSHVVAEIDGSGAVTALYVRAGDMLLEEIRGGVAKMYEADGLGSTRSLLDTTGAQTDTWNYEAFGTTLLSTGSGLNPYRFAGERFVDSVRMYQNRARWLDTRIGRFTAADKFPFSEEDLADEGAPPYRGHLHLYAHADPINFVDPMGEVEYTILGVTFTVTVSDIGRSVEGGAKGGAVRRVETKIGEVGVRSVKELRQLRSIGKLEKTIDGEAADIHHLFERRLLQKAYGDGLRSAGYEMEEQIPGVLIKKSAHQAITAAWRTKIPYVNSPNFSAPAFERILQAAEEIYSGNPQIVKELLLYAIPL
jgi:RHS repeat-associated protein